MNAQLGPRFLIMLHMFLPAFHETTDHYCLEVIVIFLFSTSSLLLFPLQVSLISNLVLIVQFSPLLPSPQNNDLCEILEV